LLTNAAGKTKRKASRLFTSELRDSEFSFTAT